MIGIYKNLVSVNIKSYTGNTVITCSGIIIYLVNLWDMNNQ